MLHNYPGVLIPHPQLTTDPSYYSLFPSYLRDRIPFNPFPFFDRKTNPIFSYPKRLFLVKNYPEILEFTGVGFQNGL